MSSRFPARLNIDEFATVNRRGLVRALGAASASGLLALMVNAGVENIFNGLFELRFFG